MDGARILTITATTIGSEAVAIITGAPETSLCVGANLSTSIGVSCTLVDVWDGRETHVQCVLWLIERGREGVRSCSH